MNPSTPEMVRKCYSQIPQRRTSWKKPAEAQSLTLWFAR